MGKAYSDDLRRKVLERHEKGEDTLEDLADQFGVSLGWAYKISAAFSRTGKMERSLPARVGRKRKATPEIEQFISETVRARSDITLAELQAMLYEKQQLELSIGALWNLVDRLGLRFKKNPARQRAGPGKGAESAA
jgi:transposase